MLNHAIFLQNDVIFLDHFHASLLHVVRFDALNKNVDYSLLFFPMDDEDQHVFNLTNARIVRIETVADKYLAPIVAHCHPDLFPSFNRNSPDAVTFEKAVRRFRGFLVDNDDDERGGSLQNEPLDIDQLTLAAGVGPDESNLLFFEDGEKRFASLLTTTDAVARCLIEWQEPLSKRSRGYGGVAVPQTKAAFVTGRWPTLSNSVLFDIHAAPFSSNGSRGGVPEYDALKGGTSIYPAPIERVSLLNLHRMLRQGAMYREEQANWVLRSLFPTVYAADASASASAATVHATVAGPGGAGTPIDITKPHDNTFDVAELMRVINATSGGAASWANLDNDRAFFPTLWMFFFAAELNTAIGVYGKRWREVLVRGGPFILHMHKLITTAPHVLCFDKLKMVEVIRQQTTLKNEKESLNDAAMRTQSSVIDRECSAMRGLLLLPELGYRTFRQTLARNNRATPVPYVNVLSPDELAIVTTAIDFYNSIMWHDLLARPDSYVDEAHESRIEQSEHGQSSGHMFTVIDDGPRVSVAGFDTGTSHGTFSLDHFWEQTARSKAEAERELALAVQMQQDTATTTQAVEDEDVVFSDEEDTITSRACVPTQTYRQHNQTSAGDSNLSVRHACRDVISRLSAGCTAEQLAHALQWLCDRGVCIREKMIGTGPTNLGRPFDTFYIASVHAKQARFVEIMSDIYMRGIQHAVWQSKMKKAPGYNEEAAYTTYLADKTEFEGTMFYLKRAREYARTLGFKHADLISRTNGGVSAATEEVDGVTHAAPTTPAEVAHMASTLLTNVAAFFTGDAPTIDPNNPYATLLPPTRLGEKRRTFGLSANPKATISQQDDAVEFIPEQMRAIERARLLPVVIITGAAGTGKTAVLKKIIEPYPSGQVLTLGPTARATDILSKRVHPSMTIHSFLFRALLYTKELRRATNILAALQASARRYDSGSDANAAIMASIVNMRAELYRLLGVVEHTPPWENIRVVVVDEASLIPLDLIVQLIEVIHGLKTQNGAFCVQFIIAGDRNQLPPIGAGCFLSDMCRAFPHCVQHLTYNHRSSGHRIRQLANAVASQKIGSPSFPFPPFGGMENERRLVTSAQVAFTGAESHDEQERIKAEADDASVCFIPADNRSYPRQLRMVLETLGALGTSTPERDQIRRSIMQIAPTRAVVERANRLTRGLYLKDYVTAGGEQVVELESGEVQLPMPWESRIAPGDVFGLKTNSHKTFMLPLTDDDDDDDLQVAARQTTAAVQALDDAVTESGLQANPPAVRVTNQFINGEQLEAVAFYEENRFSGWCRCGACLPQPEGEAPYPRLCILQPHEPPLAHRVREQGRPLISYHNAGMGYRNGAVMSIDRQKRRMAVVRLVCDSTRFKEIDVARQLANRGQHMFMRASTIHAVQGSESPIVILTILNNVRHFDPSAIYTSITRTETKFICIGSDRAFKDMATRAPFIRRSNISFMLAKKITQVHQVVTAMFTTPQQAQQRHNNDDDDDDSFETLAMPSARMLADVLRFDDSECRAFVDPGRVVDETTRNNTWLAFDRIRARAYERAAEEMGQAQ